MKSSTAPQRIVRLFLLILILTLFLGYLAYQARFLLIGPVITFSDNLDTVQTSRTIELSGHAANITAIAINGHPIVTDEAGYFTAPIVLENGYTIISIEAQDRYGRTDRHERTFVYTASSTPTTSINS